MYDQGKGWYVIYFKFVTQKLKFLSFWKLNKVLQSFSIKNDFRTFKLEDGLNEEQRMAQARKIVGYEKDEIILFNVFYFEEIKNLEELYLMAFSVPEEDFTNEFWKKQNDALLTNLTVLEIVRPEYYREFTIRGFKIKTKEVPFSEIVFNPNCDFTIPEIIKDGKEYIIFNETYRSEQKGGDGESMDLFNH